MLVKALPLSTTLRPHSIEVQSMGLGKHIMTHIQYDRRGQNSRSILKSSVLSAPASHRCQAAAAVVLTLPKLETDSHAELGSLQRGFYLLGCIFSFVYFSLFCF